MLDSFENILLNGCMHNNSENKRLWVKISQIHKNGQNFAQIEFKDNGIGIREKRKKIIFKRNYDQKVKTGGMGIGLSLVKEIIDGYGGELRVKNRVRGDYTQGSNFLVLLKKA